MDVATLGIVVDSSQASKATTALSGLAAAAKPATTAATGLAAATHGAATAHTALSTQSMAAFHSMRSMAEGFAAGQPVLQMAAQQLNHISYAASGPQGLVGAFKGALGAFSGLISPAMLITGGLIGIGAAASIATMSIIKTEKGFDDVSRAAGTTTGFLHGLESAAAFKGIDSASFLAAMEKFGHSVYEAKNDMGGLADVFRANNAHASTFNDYLFKAADLIKNCKNDQQRLAMLQQLGLPATMDWVRLLAQGKDGIAAASAEAAKFDTVASDKLVANARKFDEQWAITWKNFSTNSRSALVTAVDYMGQLYDAADRVAKNAGNSSFWDRFLPANHAEIAKEKSLQPLTGGDIANGRVRGGFDAASELPTNTALQRALQERADAAKSDPSIDRQALMKRIQDEQPRIGLLGRTVPVQQIPANTNKENENDSSYSRRAA